MVEHSQFLQNLLWLLTENQVSKGNYYEIIINHVATYCNDMLQSKPSAVSKVTDQIFNNVQQNMQAIWFHCKVMREMLTSCFQKLDLNLIGLCLQKMPKPLQNAHINFLALT